MISDYIYSLYSSCSHVHILLENDVKCGAETWKVCNDVFSFQLSLVFPLCLEFKPLDLFSFILILNK